LHESLVESQLERFSKSFDGPASVSQRTLA
jgi:hypothetical protein